jgi:metal-responsive CopG/Arc/MetJ family transcriptional regulator
MASAISADEALIERARVISGIEDRDELIRRALESFIRREAAERLIALGGSQSDAWAPERGRPW